MAEFIEKICNPVYNNKIIQMTINCDFIPLNA